MSPLPFDPVAEVLMRARSVLARLSVAAAVVAASASLLVAPDASAQDSLEAVAAPEPPTEAELAKARLCSLDGAKASIPDGEWMRCLVDSWAVRTAGAASTGESGAAPSADWLEAMQLSAVVERRTRLIAAMPGTGKEWLRELEAIRPALEAAITLGRPFQPGESPVAWRVLPGDGGPSVAARLEREVAGPLGAALDAMTEAEAAWSALAQRAKTAGAKDAQANRLAELLDALRADAEAGWLDRVSDAVAPMLEVHAEAVDAIAARRPVALTWADAASPSGWPAVKGAIDGLLGKGAERFGGKDKKLAKALKSRGKAVAKAWKAAGKRPHWQAPVVPSFPRVVPLPDGWWPGDTVASRAPSPATPTPARGQFEGAPKLRSLDRAALKLGLIGGFEVHGVGWRGPYVGTRRGEMHVQTGPALLWVEVPGDGACRTVATDAYIQTSGAPFKFAMAPFDAVWVGACPK